MEKEGLIQKLTGFKPAAVAEGTALGYQQPFMAFVEQVAEIDPQVSATTRAVSTVVQYGILAPAYEHFREKGMAFAQKKGWIKEKREEAVTNGEARFDKVYGFIAGACTAGVNVAGYCLFGDSRVRKTIVPALIGAGLMSLGNTNGRLIDSMLEINGLPNQGRAYNWAKGRTPEDREQLRKAANFISIDFPIAYYLGTKLVAML